MLADRVNTVNPIILIARCKCQTSRSNQPCFFIKVVIIFGLIFCRGPYVQFYFIITSSSHLKIITKSCPCDIQIYFKVVKIEKLQEKNFDIFLIFAHNIYCGYTLEPPRRGGSNEYQQSMFWSKNKKNRYTPVYPSFSI